MASTLADAAKRLHDIVSLHMLASNGECVGEWIAVRLVDGGSDNHLYPQRRTAWLHQPMPELCAYLLIPPDGMPLKAAESFMKTHRAFADAGIKFTDPDGPDPVQRIAEDLT